MSGLYTLGVVVTVGVFVYLVYALLCAEEF